MKVIEWNEITSIRSPPEPPSGALGLKRLSQSSGIGCCNSSKFKARHPGASYKVFRQRFEVAELAGFREYQLEGREGLPRLGDKTIESDLSQEPKGDGGSGSINELTMVQDSCCFFVIAPNMSQIHFQRLFVADLQRFRH